MRPRQIAILVIAASLAAVCATGTGAVVPTPQHHATMRPQAKAAIRTRHYRQVDVNDLAGRGAWRGCATAGATVAGPGDSATMAAIYCGRAPIYLAAAEAAPGGLA